MTRIALLGSGQIANVHLACWKRIPGIEVPYVLSSDPSRAGALLALAPEASVVSDLSTILRDDAVDAVDICGHTVQRKPLAMAAAAAGKTVLLEKPAALSVVDFDEMATAFRTHGVIATVGQTMRFQPVVAGAQAAIAAGEIGRPVAVVSATWVGYLWPGGWRAWQTSREQAGGLIHNGVHPIDLAVAMLDARPVEVFARGWQTFHRRIETPDSFQIVLSFDTGALATLDMSYAIRRAGTHVRSLLVVGTEGTLHHDTARDGGLDSDRHVPEPDAVADAMGHQIRHWARVAAGEEAPIVTLAQARAVLTAAAAADLSLQTGTTIRLDELG